jgi:hypothetical protein
MRQSITRPQATRSSIASSRARSGSTTMERKKRLRVLSCAALARIRRSKLCRDPRAGYPQDGKACCTSRLAVGRGGSTFGVDQATGGLLTRLLRVCPLTNLGIRVLGWRFFGLLGLEVCATHRASRQIIPARKHFLPALTESAKPSVGVKGRGPRVKPEVISAWRIRTWQR